MELRGEEGLRNVPDALVGSVVQVDKERFPVRRQRRRIHGISVVLGGNVAAVRAHAAHGLVVAAMAVRQLERLRARRQGHELASEAHAENRTVALERLPQMGDGFRTHGRVAGPVGQEQAVIVHPRETRHRRILCLTPQSTRTTRFEPFP